MDLFRITPSGAAGLAFAAFCFAVVPAVAGSFWLSVFTSAACFTMAISGVAFMYARLGMVSLTQVGLMGVGGWVTLRLNYATELPFEINMILAALATMICGWVLALPALRMRGLYLALVTLMAGGGLEILFATFQFPNGGEGFWGVKLGSTGEFRGPILAQSPEAYLRYVVVCVTLGFLFLEAHRRLFPGRAWALIRRSEAAAMASGINVTLYKTWAFGIAGLLAGASGALLAGSLGLLDDGTFRAPESIMLFALAAVGGARYWLGAVVAAVLYRLLPNLFNDWGLDSDLAFVIFGAVLAVHVRGAFLMAKHCVPHMGRGGGSITITSSVAGLRGDPGVYGYITAKHAQTGLMRVLAKELAPRGIRVNTINPGPVGNGFQARVEADLSGILGRDATEFFDAAIPMGRHATPDEIARSVLYLVSDMAAFTTGTVLPVDGGMSV